MDVVNSLLFCILSMTIMSLEKAIASTPAERATAQSLLHQINAAISAGEPSVTIAPGDYRIGSSSNTILPIYGASNLTIIAEGVNLIATDLKQVISFGSASNVTLRGATIDYDPLPFTQGTVVNISGSTFEVEIHDGYKTVTGNQRVIVYDPATSRVKDGTITRYGTGITTLGNGNLRLARGTTQDTLALGDFVSITGDTQIPHGVFVQNSTNVTLQDVTLHASTSFGFFENGGGSNEYRNVQVVPGPLPSGASIPRLLSSNADAFHSKHTSVGPKIINSHFANQGDDGIAINTDFHLVGSSNGTILEIGAKTTYDQLRFQVGDRIRGFNVVTGEVTEAIVQSITRDTSLDSGLSTIRNTHLPTAANPLNVGYRLTLDQPLNLNPGDLVSSPDRNGSGFEIRDTTVENHRARGILVKASDGLIENNVVDGSTIGGIVLAPEPFYWQEAAFTENVVIRGNTVMNTSRQFGQPSQTQVAGIAITSDYAWVGRNHSNILIENNLIDSIAGPGLIVSLADGVRVNSNQFINTHEINSSNGTSVGVDPTAVVWVDRASNVSFTGNTVKNLGSFGDKLLRVSAATDGLSGVDTGIRLIHEEPSLTIANYRDDFQFNNPVTGWQYLWNSGGPVGDPKNYTPLISAGGDYTLDGSSTPTANPATYARLGPENGHPGLGSLQSGASGVSRSVIAAYIVTSEGEYAIRDSFIRAETNSTELDVLIHINSESPTYYDVIEAGATASFDTSLGQLNSGDTIYVTVGPTIFDVNDFFTFDFSIDLLAIPGDFNVDSRVDGLDFLQWQRERNVGNLDDWQGYYGALLAESASVATIVPEPNTLFLMLSSILSINRGSNPSGRQTRGEQQ